MAEGGGGGGKVLAEDSPELAMIETKMRSLLNRHERRVLRNLAQAYASDQMNINQFVEALLHLLSSTPEKVIENFFFFFQITFFNFFKLKL